MKLKEVRQIGVLNKAPEPFSRDFKFKVDKNGARCFDGYDDDTKPLDLGSANPKNTLGREQYLATLRMSPKVPKDSNTPIMAQEDPLDVAQSAMTIKQQLEEAKHAQPPKSNRHAL